MSKILKNEQQDLKQFIGKMVFLVCHSEDVESTDEFFITEDWDTLSAHLSSIEVDADTIPRVLYGVLTSADFLPKDADGEKVYLVAEDPDDSLAIFVHAGFTDMNAMKDLAATIDDAIGEDKTSFVLSRRDLTIDHLFVLYGQGLTLGYSVHKDSIDEPAVDSCIELYKEISRIREAIKK